MCNTAIALKTSENGLNTLLQVLQTLISVTQEIIKREYRNAYKPWKLLMFPGFFTSPETLWNVVKRGEKESREYPAEDEENGAENLCHGADKNS